MTDEHAKMEHFTLFNRGRQAAVWAAFFKWEGYKGVLELSVIFEQELINYQMRSRKSSGSDVSLLKKIHYVQEVNE